MDILSELPTLFQQMQGEEGSKLLMNLMRFTAAINTMDPDTVVAFYQALGLLEESQPKGTIFSRPAHYRMLQKTKTLAQARMYHLLKSAGQGTDRQQMIFTLEKALPGIEYVY